MPGAGQAHRAVAEPTDRPLAQLDPFCARRHSGAAPSTRLFLRTLPDVGLRQLGDQQHVARHHEALEPRAALADHLLLGQLGVLLEHDVGADGLAEQLVGTPITAAWRTPAIVVDRVLDLDRADLLAARLDDVVAAVDEVEVAVLVGGEVVVGAEHPLARAPARPRASAPVSSGRPPVARHHVRAADVEDADLARRRPRCRRSSSTNASVPGIALPTDVGCLVDQLRLQVADADALGLAVHAEQPGVREDARAAASCSAGGGPAAAFVRQRTERMRRRLLTSRAIVA